MGQHFQRYSVYHTWHNLFFFWLIFIRDWTIFYEKLVFLSKFLLWRIYNNIQTFIWAKLIFSHWEVFLIKITAIILRKHWVFFHISLYLFDVKFATSELWLNFHKFNSIAWIKINITLDYKQAYFSLICLTKMNHDCDHLLIKFVIDCLICT